MKMNVVIAMVVAIVLAFNCSSGKKPLLNPGDQASDKKMYELAIKNITRDPEKARLLFKQIIQLFPDSIYSTKAKLGVADSYFKEKVASSLIVAASEYQEYITLFPYSPDAIYAKFQIAMCYYNQIRKPERDQTNALNAIKAFEAFLQQYPTGKEAEDAKKKILAMRQILAEHFYRIGYYNYKLGAMAGAITRFKQVIDEYPDFTQNDKLYFFMGLVLEKMKNFDLALSYYQKITAEFPKSAYYKKTLSHMKEVNLQKAKIQPPAPVKTPDGDKKDN